MNDRIIKSDGWYWPATDEQGREAILGEINPAIDWLLYLMFETDWPEVVDGTILQAGANTGIYPQRLTEHFSRVVTAEPDADNYACLIRNCVGLDIEKHYAAFGHIIGTCGVDRFEPNNCGAHRVDLEGDVPMITIDSLQLAPDVIWLDIEGYELKALLGATQTIQAHHPLILVEEKGLGRFYGSEKEDLAEHLMLMGYEWISSHGADNAYRWRGK